MSDKETLRQQILKDLELMQILIDRYASGDVSVKAQRDRLESEIKHKKILWRMVKDL